MVRNERTKTVDPVSVGLARRCVAIVFAWSGGIAIADESYSPYAGDNFPTQVYFGDAHLHTNLSHDAYAFGNRRLSAEEAYRFARGETVTASNGMEVRLRRPLDFLVIADHSDSLGVMVGIDEGNAALLNTDAGRRLLKSAQDIKSIEKSDPRKAEALSVDLMSQMRVAQKLQETGFDRSVWKDVVADADRYNDPGRFTTFAGFEWTSNGTDHKGNLHRVVVFADGAEKTAQIVPFTSADSDDPERLWEYLAAYEKRTGGEVLAIPHNGNVSNGEMFALQTFSGESLTADYVATRSRWEPLYEVTQIKGTSEAHPFLSPTDEFADYEIWNSWAQKNLPESRSWDDRERTIKEGEYARPALKRGLQLHATFGVNPFKFGFVGGTDAHTSLSAVDENNFWGKAPITNPSERRIGNELGATNSIALVSEAYRKLGFANPSEPLLARDMSASGYAAIWATENTREALFAAMKRKETYATTGPRMVVRFFGGWEYEPEDARRSDMHIVGYRKGVPMGGDLTHAPAGESPRFLIRAVKDPDGAYLDRIQVIKGWRDKSGDLQEKIYDVALSDGREVDENGKAPLVGSTVDLDNATYTNTIGAPELAAVWKDPDFDPEELAFYYVRVIEIPTPRWTAYDAKFFKVKNVASEVEMVTQERAYTSPIWYSPR